MMRAGRAVEVSRHSGEWLFVDVGFAKRARSCGLLRGDGQPEALSFADLRDRLCSNARSKGSPLNLLLEAPLSVAFSSAGNPTGRSFERREKQTRYWYVGLGSSVMVAALYLLRAVHDLRPRREIRLFEGMVSFKEKGARSSHLDDVRLLREVVWDPKSGAGMVISAEKFGTRSDDRVESAFRVSGMDFGVPAVVVAGVQQAAPARVG